MARVCVCVCVCVKCSALLLMCVVRAGGEGQKHDTMGEGREPAAAFGGPGQRSCLHPPCPASLCAGATPCPLVSPLAGVGPRGVLGVEDLEGERWEGDQSITSEIWRVYVSTSRPRERPARPAAAGQQALCFDRPSGCHTRERGAAHLLRLILQAAGQLVHLSKDGHPRVGQPRPTRHLRGMGAGRQVACRMSCGR